MLDRTGITDGVARLRAVAGPGLPVAKLILGKPVDEAVTLLPRLFNLCRAAQERAITRALCLPDGTADLAAEITRDHLLKLFVQWPGYFGQAPGVAPGLFQDPHAVRHALFGDAAALPSTPEDMTRFLASDHGVAPLLRRIGACFGPGDAVADGLALVDETNAFSLAPVENSAAARRAHLPMLQAVETEWGRGPLWRAIGRMIDLSLILDGDLPCPAAPIAGRAVVPATRRLYAVEARADAGVLTAFFRVTPTDHMLAKDGMLDRALASLPADRTGMAPLLLDILDPCSPVRLEEVAHA